MTRHQTCVSGVDGEVEEEQEDQREVAGHDGVGVERGGDGLSVSRLTVRTTCVNTNNLNGGSPNTYLDFSSIGQHLMGIILLAAQSTVVRREDNPRVYGEIDYKIDTFMVSINDQ